MTVEEARIKLSKWINKEKKTERDPDEFILGYFIAPIDEHKYYDFLKKFRNLDTSSMIELFRSNGDLQKSIEQEDVDVFYFRGLHWKTMRKWKEENDLESDTIYIIPREFCRDKESE